MKVRRLSWCRAAILRRNTIGDSAGDEVSNGLTIVSLRWKSSSSRFAIYEGNMNTQSPYVDANNSYGVTRSFNEYTLSASPRFLNHTSNYVQEPIQSNLHASTSYDTSNRHHVYSNSHTSAAQQIYMPMNNMANLVNQYETPNVRNFNNMQTSVSFFLFIGK